MTNITPSSPDIVEGYLANIVYADKKSDWSILSLRNNDSNIEVCGLLKQKLHVGEHLKCFGVLAPSPYGEDLEFDRIITKPPQEEDALTQYLTSVCNINLGDSRKLVTGFGSDVIHILDFDIGRLSELIDDNETCKRIGLRWKTRRGEAQANAELDNFGIPASAIKAVQQFYGEGIKIDKLLNQDPFLLYRASRDVGFNQMMAIAKKHKIDRSHASTIKGSLVAILRQNEIHHAATILKLDQLPQRINAILGYAPSKEIIEKALKALKNEVIYDDEIIQLAENYQKERNIAEQLYHNYSQVLNWDVAPSVDHAKNIVKDWANLPPIEDFIKWLDQPISNAHYYRWETLYTTINCIHQLTEGFSSKIRVVTNGNHAANLLSDKLPTDIVIDSTGRALGIHEFGPPNFRASNPWPEDIIIITQSDRISNDAFLRILSAVGEQKKVVIMGTPSAVPSAGVGDPFTALSSIIDPLVLDQPFEEKNIGGFNPTIKISSLNCTEDEIETAINALINEVAPALKVPGLDISTVTLGDVSDNKLRTLTNKLLARNEKTQLGKREYFIGEPVIMMEASTKACDERFSRYQFHKNEKRSITLTNHHGLTIRNKDEAITLFPCLGSIPRFACQDTSKFTLALIPAKATVDTSAVNLLMANTQGPVVLIGDLEQLTWVNKPLLARSNIALRLCEMAQNSNAEKES